MSPSAPLRADEARPGVPAQARLVLESLFADFVPTRFGAFRPFRPGVEILPLYGMDESGAQPSVNEPSAAFLRYEPGASVPLHVHRGYEHIFVLSGSQRDHEGVYGRGTCVISAPGTRHAVASDEGCLVLAIWQRAVEILEGSEP